MINTPLTKRLGIKHPVLCAPMAGVAGGRLARAVSDAGGFGIVGGGYGEGDWLANELADDRCDDIGVGFITWRLQQRPELLDVALAVKPRAIFLSFGDISEFASRIKKAGCTLIAQVQSVAQAADAAATGADIVVAQGTEAGGHGGPRATLPLVPAVVDALPSIPVVAAGGIADGRGLAAALMLGATGVVIGTRFYCSEESLPPPEAKMKVLAASGDATTRTSVFDVLREYDWPQPYNLRTLVNTMTDTFGEDLEGLRADKNAQIARFQQAVLEKDYDVAPIIAGEAVDLIDTIPTAGDIVAQIVGDAAKLLTHPPHIEIS